ncbi:MAG: hypothetical protein PHQ24_09780 [Proteiniphilum sp.]|nr:hypothetical protein [Proteiniphilum sp.]
MERYKNLGGDSGVSGYDSGNDYIRVYFKNGSVYLYNNSRPGSRYVSQMVKLAQYGKGLNAFINTTIKKNYAIKER